MQLIDIKILREIHRDWLLTTTTTEDPSLKNNNIISSLRSIAVALNVSKDTVSSRIKNLKSSGLLLGWSAFPNPNLVSLKVAHIWLEFSEEEYKKRALEILAQLNKIRILYNYVGPALSYVYASDISDSLDRHLVEDIKARVPIKRSTLLTIRFAECKSKFNEIDQKIYNCIRQDFEKPITKISEEVGLSTRTIQRRLKILAKNNALLLAPRLNFAKIDGIAMHLVVTTSNRNSEGDVFEKISLEADDCVVYSQMHYERCIMFSLIANNFARANAICKFAESLPGTLDVRPYYILDAARIRDQSRLAIRN